MSLCSLVLSLDSCDGPSKWAWKKSTDPADVQNFLNGNAPYLAPLADARISAREMSGWNSLKPEGRQVHSRYDNSDSPIHTAPSFEDEPGDSRSSFKTPSALI